MFELFKPKNYGKVVDVHVKKEHDYKLLYENQRTITKCLVQACLDIIGMAELKAQGDDVYLTRCAKVREAVNKAKETV